MGLNINLLSVEFIKDTDKFAKYLNINLLSVEFIKDPDKFAKYLNINPDFDDSRGDNTVYTGIIKIA